MATLLTLQEPGSAPASAAPPPGGNALWALGFRPFYLAAGAWAALSVPIWVLQFALAWPQPALHGGLWHAHEMIFGFALAVIVGFLFTAGRNWSGQATPTGRTLQALLGLWLVARLLALSPWPVASLLANLAFPLAAAWGLGRALLAGSNRRNYFFVGLLALMAAASGVFHLSLLHQLPLSPRLGTQLALDVVLLIVGIMAGRVVPMFTNNGVPGAGATRHDGLERLALGGLVALLAADMLAVATPWGEAAAARVGLGLLLLVLAAVHAARLALWHPWATHGNPLVWVLHLAYAFVPLHLLLRGLAAWGWLAPGPATHALTVGTIGLITLGMMTRSARGHTARPLVADRIDRLSYTLVAAAALVRVLLPLAWPAATVAAAVASAVLWSVGFGTFAVHYAPWLCRPRLDGRPG